MNRYESVVFFERTSKRSMMKAKLKRLTKYLKSGILRCFSDRINYFSTKPHHGSFDEFDVSDGSGSIVGRSTESLALKKIMEITDAMVDASHSMPHLGAILMEYSEPRVDPQLVDIGADYLMYERYLCSIGCSSSVQGMKSDSLDAEHGSVDTSYRSMDNYTAETSPSLISFKSTETTYYDSI
ncbi:hypothetical protein CLIB1444_06S04676 [[Candida] jaroonii]|uniref:Uncharacterized protein n=1 Tax=[Candida] jaroonii TaxID=467808 RepID=A0ACA9Y9G3_9ASCO|nr:hypothetical protein CLIB1444_06S04676 [[Candida] jaroonii]